MKRTEIDDTTYEIIRTQTVAWFLPRLLNNLELARQEAQALMDSTYVRRSRAMQCESQKDYFEYEEEMSLGGQTYRTR